MAADERRRPRFATARAVQAQPSAYRIADRSGLSEGARRSNRGVPMRVLLIVAVALWAGSATLAQEPGAPVEPPPPTFPIPLPVDIVEDQAAADARERSEAEARQRELEHFGVRLDREGFPRTVCRDSNCMLEREASVHGSIPFG